MLIFTVLTEFNFVLNKIAQYLMYRPDDDYIESKHVWV